mgnify:FL=1
MTNKQAQAAQLQALAALSGGGAPPAGNLMGQYVTAAMLAAAQDQCACETCKLMRRASKAMRAGLLEGDDDA